MDDELQRLRAEAKHLKESILRSRRASCDISMLKSTEDVPPLGKLKLIVKKSLRGHIAKVYALQWGSDSKHMVSAAQDGRLLFWDTATGQKLHNIHLLSNWVMSCALSLDRKMICSGGLDSMCTVYVRKPRSKEFKRGPILTGHTSYLSCCRFLGDDQILTSSGDKTCILWDLNTSKPVSKFIGHTNDVMSFSISPDLQTFVSAGCDHVCKLWDFRTGACCQTLNGHSDDINAVSFFPSGDTFVTGSDDSTCRLFDIRSDQELMEYRCSERASGVTSLAVSKSGRIFFAGKDDYNCDIWDLLKGTKAGTLDTENGRVSCMGIPPDGTSIATGSWDNLLRIWN